MEVGAYCEMVLEIAETRVKGRGSLADHVQHRLGVRAMEYYKIYGVSKLDVAQARAHAERVVIQVLPEENAQTFEEYLCTIRER